MSRSDSPREKSTAKDEIVCGFSAARAAFEMRTGDVRRIYYTVDTRMEIGEMLREASKRRIAYEEVDDAGLEKLTESTHHEGIALRVLPRRPATRTELFEALVDDAVVLVLESVGNPHNVGGIIRTAAFFGAVAVVVGAEGQSKPRLPPSAVRIAEGGAEYLETMIEPDVVAFLREVRAKTSAKILGLDVRGEDGPDALGEACPRVIVLGAERHGMTEKAAKLCDRLIHVPGTGNIDSLNVSVAAGVALAFAFAGDEKSAP